MSENQWVLPERLVRSLHKLAKLSEWAEFNWKWKQRCCPACGAPESYRQHDPVCPLLKVIAQLEVLHPQVTQALPLDPLTEIEAQELERLLLGGIQDAARKAEERKRRFWEE